MCFKANYNWSMGLVGNEFTGWFKCFKIEKANQLAESQRPGVQKDFDSLIK